LLQPEAFFLRRFLTVVKRQDWEDESDVLVASTACSLPVVIVNNRVLSSSREFRRISSTRVW